MGRTGPKKCSVLEPAAPIPISKDGLWGLVWCKASKGGSSRYCIVTFYGKLTLFWPGKFMLFYSSTTAALFGKFLCFFFFSLSQSRPIRIEILGERKRLFQKSIQGVAFSPLWGNWKRTNHWSTNGCQFSNPKYLPNVLALFLLFYGITFPWFIQTSTSWPPSFH